MLFCTTLSKPKDSATVIKFTKQFHCSFRKKKILRKIIPQCQLNDKKAMPFCTFHCHLNCTIQLNRNIKKTAAILLLMTFNI